MNTKQNLSRIIQGLQSLRQRSDQAFARVSGEYPGLVACRPGCEDCCHALFDLAPVEALAISLAFVQLPRQRRREALRRADKAVDIFNHAFQNSLGKTGEERLALLSKARVPCPLLDKKGCILYEERPVTCRLYGIPVAIQGRSRTCGLAGFKQGDSYPTVDLGMIQAELDRLSQEACSTFPFLPTSRRDVARVIISSQDLNTALTKQ